MTTSSFNNASAMTHQNEVSGASRDRYTRVAIGLHWAIAVFIIFNLSIGYFMGSWPMPIQQLAKMLHFSAGLTVLALTLARVVWRLLNAPPAYPAGMKPWERHTAHFAHFLLYAAMVLMPLSGWAIVSSHAPPGSRAAAFEMAAYPPPGMPAARPGLPAARPGMPSPPPGMPARGPGGRPALKIWNLLPLPLIGPIEDIGAEPGGVPAQHKLNEEFIKWHSVGGWLLIGLLILHVAGALKHQFIDRHAELARMGIGGKRR